MKQDADILETDRIYFDEMARANEVFLRSLRGRPAPRVKFRPRLINGYSWQPDPNSRSHIEANRRADEHRAEKARIDALRVSRDPCPMCGTRGDLSCRHRP